MKGGARILGIDDSPFTRSDKKVLVVGVVYREGLVEGVLSTKVERDGSDSTQKLISLVKGSRFKPQLRLVMLNSINLAGFNVVDINKLSSELGMPVIAVTRKKPRDELVRSALKKVAGCRKKLELVEKAGEAFKITSGKSKWFVQLAGISEREAGEVLRTQGVEAIRTAHVIASGIILGESRGRV